MEKAITWSPIKANSGRAMLIEGKRIGLYAENVSFSRSRRAVYSGVCYVLLTLDEYNKFCLRPDKDLEFSISFASVNPPTLANLSRLVTGAYQDLDIATVYVGIDFAGRDTPYSVTEMQQNLLKFYQWIESCIEY